MPHLKALITAAAILPLAFSVHAETPVSPPTMPMTAPAAAGPSLKLSIDLAQAAIDACQAKGLAASAAVVDSAGVLKVLLRADKAPKPPVAAPLKAATAVAFDAPGSELQPREKTDPQFAATMLAHKDTYNDHPGSLPLHQDGKLIGGLAVADVDHAMADTCAREALKRFSAVVN